jgi:coenzyme Q-binding protein COQ10
MPTHAEKRHLPYRPDQVYDIVAAVDRYPEFLPWCRAARVTRRDGDVFEADVVATFKVFRERFTSRVRLIPKTGIDVEYIDGPFRYLKNSWRFLTAPDGGCIVDFHVEFEFRSKVLQTLIGLLFDEAIRRMVAAFEARARQLYGAPQPAPEPQEAAGSRSAAGVTPGPCVNRARTPDPTPRSA